MKTIRTHYKPTNEEKETLLNYNFVKKTWTMDSTVRKHFNKALKQGWVPVTKYEHDDGTIVGYVLEAPGHSVTIRSVEKRQMSEKQLSNLTNNEDEDDEE